MSFTESISACFNKYAEFGGRARRSEYWWFVLFQMLIGLGISMAAGALGTSDAMTNGLSGLFGLAMLLPTIAVGARRFHDVNRNGWWQLIPITIIGIVPYFYWLCKAGDPQANQYGPPV